jgi:hypothetical protein
MAGVPHLQAPSGKAVFDRVSAMRSIAGGSPEAFLRAFMHDNSQLARAVGESAGKRSEQKVRSRSSARR